MIGSSADGIGGTQQGSSRAGLYGGATVLLGAVVFAGLLPLSVMANPYETVAKIFANRCVVCHGGPNAVQALRLDSYSGVMAGSVRGPVVRPGDPDGSELVKRLRGISQPRMPLTGPPYLDELQIAAIAAWIAAGARAGAGGEADVVAARRPLPAPGAVVTYRDVAPILLQRCVKCHGANSILGAPPEGLQLGSLGDLLRGGERVVIVPGNPGASELYRRIVGFSVPRMPFDGPPYLDAEEIRVLGEWVAQGARDDAGRPAPMPIGAAVRLQGTLDGYWSIDGASLQIGDRTRVDKSPRIGDRVEVRGTVAADGAIVVSRLRRR